MGVQCKATWTIGLSCRTVSNTCKVCTDIKDCQQCMDEDRCWTVKESGEHTGISGSTVRWILWHDLKMRRIGTKWVPHRLNELQQWTRCEACINLERHRREGDMLNRIIATDGTWSRAYEVEFVPCSSEWHHSHLPRKCKVRQNPTSTNLLLILVYDVQGVVVCHHPPPQNQTVNAQYLLQVISAIPPASCS
jgi:hypothetical protein